MRTRVVVAGLAAATFVVRLVFQQELLSSDEAGLLMVGSQWGPGSSLYGDYWIDRPPGLIAVFTVADALGGMVAVRVLGAAAAAGAVLAAAWLGGLTAPGNRWAPVICAGVVGTLISNPLLDADEVSAEILALPFLVGGLAALVAAVRHRPTGGLGWAVAAGVAGTTAVSFKQNLVDVWLAVGVVVVVLLARRDLARAARLLAGFLSGAALVAVPLLALTLSRGTSLGELWDAVVTFRIQAGAVIAEDASEATPQRARNLALAFVATGMPALLFLLTRLPWRMPRDADTGRLVTDAALSWGCLVLLVWEIFAVVSGGSYWLHYLLLPVPGMAVLVAASLRQSGAADVPEDSAPPRRPFPLWTVVPVAVSTVIALVLVANDTFQRPTDDRAVVAYLAEHRSLGTTAVVAFGNSHLLHDAGMTSPYEHLWSLPVRVRDPHLVELTRVLRSPERPYWIVRLGTSMTSWGIDGADADRVVRRHYRPVFAAGEYTVLAERSR